MRLGVAPTGLCLPSKTPDQEWQSALAAGHDMCGRSRRESMTAPSSPQAHCQGFGLWRIFAPFDLDEPQAYAVTASGPSTSAPRLKRLTDQIDQLPGRLPRQLHGHASA